MLGMLGVIAKQFVSFKCISDPGNTYVSFES